MQKPANRILSALLVLVMILSVLPASVFATGNAEGPFAGWSLTLGDNIGVNFYLKEEAANYSVNVTVAGNDAATTAATKDGYYVVTANVAAAQMTDTIALSVVNGDQTVHTGEYSVRQYAETILTGSYDEEVKLMVQNMLNYGAAAQNYFGYNAENLANAGYELASAATVPAEVPAINVQDDLAGIALYGMSLLFQNKTSVRFYFHGSGDMNSYTFQIGDQAYTPVAKNGQYYVQVDGINPQDLDKTIDLVVSKDGKSLTVSYSPMTYIVRKYNSADSAESLKALVQGMYGYHLEAVAYQKYLEIVKIDTLVEHPDSNNNWTSGGIYMATQEPNDAPYKSDWTLEYAPTSSSVIKRIRNGETIDVAIANRGTIVKYDTDKYYLNVNSWTMGENAPAMDGDIYIIEGDFYNSANDVTIRFAKNYIYLNGTNAEFSKEMPTLPTVIEGGMLQKVDGYGWTGGTGALIFKMANTAPNGGYAPTDASNIKLIRNGETYDVAYVGQNVINKSNDNWYTVEFWTIVNYKPMLANDILVIEGEFKQASSKTTLNISKTYVLLNADGSASFSAEMPSLTTVIDAGMMSAHANGWKSTSAADAGNLQFAMAANDAPTGYYRPTSAANVKLIRDGATYDVAHNLRDTISKVNNDQYILEFWTIADHKPMVANDILIVEGEFRQESSNTVMNITKTYILLKADGTAEFSAEMPSLATIIDAGVMGKHSSNGWNADALYFSMAENEAPAADAIRYKPENASNIKLIRDGATYDVGHNARETIVKASATGYYIALWTLGDYKPLKANDILIVEGNFTNAANNTTLNISKTYILIKGDGTAEFSTEMPSLATIIDAGVMNKHSSNGWNADALYFSMAENAAPAADAIRYKPEYASNVKLIRDGATYDVGHNQRETIVKASATGYYIALWTLGDYKPLKANDILIVEGNFTNAANNTTLNISKTYILINADGSATFSATEPVPATEVDCGVMGEHADGSASEIFFSMADNAVPVDEELEYPYAGTVQLVNGSKVSTVDVNIYKLDTDMYYLDCAALEDGQYLIVEGGFTNADNGITMNITKTYVLAVDDALVYSETEPAAGIQAGMMKAYSENKWNSTDANNPGNLWFALDNNNAPTGAYRPTNAANVKLIRNGETYVVGHTARDTINKINDSWYVFEFWTIADYKPMVAGDILIVEGSFYQASSDTTLNISKTYILLNENKTATYSATEPVPEAPGSMMQAYSENKWSSTNKDNPGNLWFALDNNDAPTGAYRPTNAANVKLIRNGETYVVGHTARDTINKINDSWYVLEFWTIADYKPMLANDILIVEGDFYQASSDTTLSIEKTYVLLNADGTASYFDSEPSIGPESNHGMMNVTNWQKPASNPDGSANDGGLYFTLAENDVIYTTDWATQYKPVSADVIKLIRDGVETNVANTGAGMIIKYSATEYYLQFWPITKKPMQAGDIMIVEGMFKNESNGCVLNIAKTYILFNENGTVSVYENSPMTIDAGTMGAYAAQNWFDTNYNALYFVLSSNIAPANTDWSVRYTPKDAANIKLVRNGNTVNIANTGAETIVKIEDGLYALALENWWLNAYAPIQDGDILIIEGGFTNAATGYTLNIDKTYITFISKANDEVVFSTVNDTEFGEVVLPNSGDTLNIGMWNGSYHVFEDKQLKQLQDAGITKIMGIDTQWIGTTDVEGWLDRVYSYGIRVIIDLRSWDGETVPSYVNHPALIGFIMFDEPCATDFDDLKALKTKFDALKAEGAMPEDKLFYVNLYGSSAAGTSLMGAVDWALGRRDYDEYYVQRFLDRVGVEVLSWDSYALLEGEGIRTGYFYNFEVMASKNMPTWYTMLSSGHKTTATYYTVPTEDELRWQMAVAMTYGVSNIDHYTYVSHEDDYSCMVEYGTWEPTDLYYDIRKVDNEYLAWDNIYMAYDWVGVGTYDAGSTNAMFSNLKKALNWKNYGISDIQSGEDLLVGVFDYNGENAYMLTNAGTPGSATVGDGKEFTMGDATVTLTLDAADYKCVAVIDNGEVSYVAVENNTVTLTVEAYEGVFVIPVLN